MEMKNGIYALRKSVIWLFAVLMLAGCAKSGQEPQSEKEDSFTAAEDTIIVTRENNLIGYIYEAFDERGNSFTAT